MVMPSATANAAGFLPRAEFDRLLQAVRADGRQLIGPRVGAGTLELAELDGASDLPAGIGLETAPGSARLVDRGDDKLFAYPTTLAGSWKQWTYPPRAGVGEWVVDDDGTIRFEAAPAAPAPPRAFVGVRACDLAAMRIHKKAISAGGADANDLVVAVDCAVAGATCFCTSMGTGPELGEGEGYDIALSELDDGFVVRAGSSAGWAIVETLDLAPAQADHADAAATQVAAVRAAMGTPLPMAGLPERLVAQPNHPRWADVAERCLACANCTLVCPTCFCTSHVQLSDLAGGSAKTERVWDSCFTGDFARVAGGNFRSRPQDRYRQWLTHKFGTWWSQFGSSGCVGCGRCITWCPVGIDVREELMAIAGPPASSPTVAPVTLATRAPLPDDETQWSRATVAATHQETSDVVTLRLATADPALLTGRPGQFAMIGLPGLATPAISISRFHEDGIELTIRAVGPTTASLTRLERGAQLSVRGPLGRGWPVEMAYGRDVQIVTGGVGLAPLRSLIDALLANRDRIGVIHLAYGARTPSDRLYRQELDELAAGGDIEIAQTVDRAGPEWLGRVGVVTQVIDRVMCACDRTVAFVCGPERMMAATADVMRQRGVPDERIFVTLERHMDCGVGVCGHCQLGRFFVCRDGPVFSLAELGGALGQEGL